VQAIVIEQAQVQLDEAALQKSLDWIWQEVLKYEVSTSDEVTIVFVEKGRMQELNRDYRGKDAPTDVLSFANDDDSSLGDLVFCVEKMQQQAASNQHSLHAEFIYLLLHGLLHLLGHDHESAEEAKRMFAIQDAIYDSWRHSECASFDCIQI
tara:strand:+ start:10628 stop:11083 length:456 start_codon:yes stop_codon:yes gene_type:complete